MWHENAHFVSLFLVHYGRVQFGLVEKGDLVTDKLVWRPSFNKETISELFYYEDVLSYGNVPSDALMCDLLRQPTEEIARKVTVEGFVQSLWR